MDFSVEGAISMLDLKAAISVLPYLELDAQIKSWIIGHEVIPGDRLCIFTNIPYLNHKGLPTGETCNIPVCFKLLPKSLLLWPSFPIGTNGEQYVMVNVGQGDYPEQTALSAFTKETMLDSQLLHTLVNELWSAWVKFLRHCTSKSVGNTWVINHPVHGDIPVVK